MIYALTDRRPQIDPTAWVAPDCHVIGDIVLAARTSLWFGCVLRGDNERISIGAGSNLQEYTICHTDMGFPLTVGENCTIGHRATLHGCIIGDNTLVGMGATVLNGARVGRNCLIGAGALVTEGKDIPDGSLVVGAPGKVVRELDDAAIAAITESAARYQSNAEQFRDGLTPL